jgi:hypothetical protein
VRHTERLTALLNIHSALADCPSLTDAQRAAVMEEALAEYRIAASPAVFLEAAEQLNRVPPHGSLVPQRSPESDPPRAPTPKRLGKGRKGTAGA